MAETEYPDASIHRTSITACDQPFEDLDQVLLGALYVSHSQATASWIDAQGLRDGRRAGRVMARRGMRGGEFWLPHRRGDRMLLVRADDPWSGRPIDIIALDPQVPSKTYALTGHGFLLGDLLLCPDVVRVHCHVHSWLHDRDSLCVLRWDAARFFLTGRPRLTLVFDGPQHARAARQAFNGMSGLIPRVVAADRIRSAA